MYRVRNVDVPSGFRPIRRRSLSVDIGLWVINCKGILLTGNINIYQRYKAEARLAVGG